MTLLRSLLACLLLSCSAHATEKLVQRASAELSQAGSGKSVPYSADVVTDPETFATELRIYADNDDKTRHYTHRLETGQEFIQTLGSRHLDGLGSVFYIEWQWGALSQGLTLYALGADGRIKEVFRDGGRYGAHILTMPGDPAPKIVILDRDNEDSTRIARIYTITRSGEIKPTEVRRSQGPFAFELKGSTPLP